jgi:hypothetical protein
MVKKGRSWVERFFSRMNEPFLGRSDMAEWGKSSVSEKH